MEPVNFTQYTHVARHLTVGDDNCWDRPDELFIVSDAYDEI